MSACDKYQEMISALLDGELTEAEQAEVHAHIASCEECRAMYEAFAAVSAAVSADVDVPESLHDGIMARVHAADKATKTLGRLISMRRILTAAACLVVIVGTVFALKNNLFPHAKSADEKSETGGAMTVYTSGASVPAEAEAPMLAMAEEAQPEEAMTESETLNTAVYGGGAGDRSPEDAPRATPAPEPASAQSDSLAVVPSVAEVRRLDEAMVLHDVEALMGALAPQETELRFDPASRESSCTLTLETDSGTERTLEIYFDGDHVWVAEENEIYLASCTPEEFEAIR